METPETSPGTSPAPRQTLAMRMAERSRLRAERAERLARLAPVRGERAPEAAGPSAHRAHPAEPAPVRFVSPERDAAAALEEFLRSLTQGLDGRQPSAQPGAQPSTPAAGEVLPFQRPASPDAPPEARASAADPDPHGDLWRLAGVGPGLAWALRRAGIPDLASVAALEPEALAARLGPLGRLVPARAWVEAARAAPDIR